MGKFLSPIPDMDVGDRVRILLLATFKSDEQVEVLRFHSVAFEEDE